MTAPWVVIFPMVCAEFSVNHRLPSGPAVMPDGQLLGVGNPIFGDPCSGPVRRVCRAEQEHRHRCQRKETPALKAPIPAS